jgi:hypothetical protein
MKLNLTKIKMPHVTNDILIVLTAEYCLLGCDTMLPSSGQKMEAAGSSEPLVNVCQTIQCHNSEDSILHDHNRENLKSLIDKHCSKYAQFIKKNREAFSRL